MAKDTLWFPHDYNARADEKTAELIIQHKATGYGVFQIITEILHEEDDSRIEYEEKKLKRLAATCGLPYEDFKAIIDDCIHTHEVWILEDGYFFSDRVIRNKADRERIRQIRVENGRRGGVANASKIKAFASKKVANATKNSSGAIAPLKQNEANGSTGQDKTEQNNSSTNVEDINMAADWLKQRRDEFKERVKPFVEKYGKELCNDFWYYWTQPHQKLKQIRWDSEKFFDIDARLRTFKNNVNKKQP